MVAGKLFYSVALITGCILISGCGATTYEINKGRNGQYASSSTTYSPVTNGGSVQIPNSPTTTPSPSPSPIGTGIPPYEFRVGAVGYTETTVTVSTRSILKVAFIAGIPDEKIPNTGFTANYSRLGVYIKVGTLSQPTQFLSNGLFGNPPEKSSVMDFSAAFNRTCVTNDPSCRQAVSVTVEKPNYDYWCLNFFVFCPWTRAESTHPWNGKLLIQTDDTNPI